MLRYALGLVSTARLGLRLKEVVRRRVKSAIVVVIACILLFIAAIFGLVAGYQALLGAGFSGVESAGIVAVALVAAALLMLALLPLIARRHRNRLARALHDEGPAGAMGVVDEQLGQVVKQVGPLGVLATAFAIGVLAGRR